MKVLILELNGKKYSTMKITAYISKEALKIQKEALEIGKSRYTINENDLEEVSGLLDQLLEIRERKAALLCEIYGNKFTVDEIEKCLSDEEIDIQMNAIMSGIGGIIAKN